MQRHDHTAFHRAAWARVLADSYDHRPFYLKIGVGGVQTALVPLMEVCSPVTGCRGVSLPFADFAGPLWGECRDEPHVLDALLDLASARRWKHIELRGNPPPLLAPPPFRTYLAHELPLDPNTAALMQLLPASTRRSIRKAERSALTISIERSPQAMRDFYTLHVRTRRRHGLPPQPLRFFQAVQRHFLQPGLGEIILARHAGSTVAGAVFLHSAGRAIYKFGASETSSWDLRPNHLVMWHAIRHLAESGCRSLHFGRTCPTDKGLIRFKSSWSCTDHDLPYCRHHTATRTWLAGNSPRLESMPCVFSHLPLSLNRIAGQLLYPHLD